MSDKINIESKDVTVPTLGNLSVPADFNLESVTLTAETVTNYEKVFQTHRTFWDRVGLFLKAENQAGRYFEAITDFALIFVPYGRQIDNTTDFIRERIFKSEQNPNDMNWLLNRLTERSTWRGLIVGVTGAGVTIAPDLQELIIPAGVAIFALVEFFVKEPESADAG